MIWVVMILYGILTLLFAFLGGRGASKSADSFLMADRNLSMPVYSLTYMATFTGGGLVMGIATLAYTSGISAQWYAMTQGLAFITIVFLIPFLRKFSAFTSVPEVLGKLYGNGTKFLGCIITLIGCLALTAGQTIGMGSLITVITGLPLVYSFWISTIVFILITYYGGLKSVAWADVFHGIMLALGIVILVPVALHNAGGWQVIVNSPEITSADLNWFGIGLVQIFTWYLMYMFTCGASQFLVQRVWAAKTTKTAVIGNLFAGTFVTFFGIFTAVAGLLAKVAAPPDLDPRLAFAWTVSNLLPEALAGILLAAAVAAVMSGADSFLLAASTTFVNDIYVPLRGGKESCSDREIVLTSRISILAFGLLAALVALSGINIVPINTLGMGLMAAPIFVALMYAMWKKTLKKAALPSIIIGGIAFAIWEFGAQRAFNVEPAVPAALATAISFYLISRLSSGSYIEAETTTKGEMKG
jgi:SSS family solute:Na+ symporter